MAGYSPSQRRVAQQIAAAAPGSDLDALLVATAMVESNLTPTAAGDGGRSHGVFQEYDLGRGSGIPISGRRNVSAATSRAFREFSALSSRFNGPELAYRAQRPADHSGYVSKVQAALPLAMQLLGSGGGGKAPGAPRRVREAAGVAPQPGGGGQLTGASLAQIRAYADRTRQQVLMGQMPESSAGIERSLRFSGAPAPRAAAPAGGHGAGDGHNHSDPAGPGYQGPSTGSPRARSPSARTPAAATRGPRRSPRSSA